MTSPGVERTLRTPAHFQREIGKELNIRLANVDAEQRRVQGVLVAADDTTATLRVEADGEIIDQVVQLDDIDRARTVFEWGPQPKPGGKGTGKGKGKKKQAAKKKSAKQSAQQPSVQKKESS